ncbi:Kinase, NEK [Giardia muris]|uniref:non-specific serine/threonine protein kinase n=1 Tax=Giardia muris TaxID=5742 RepID=A0A4Z1SSG6_GIAMU|nr:Kinase, NEK [Giardia muris]|eukprot:TNJ26598.1 Kinase, NEK [Giardia muris]
MFGSTRGYLDEPILRRCYDLANLSPAEARQLLVGLDIQSDLAYRHFVPILSAIATEDRRCLVVDYREPGLSLSAYLHPFRRARVLVPEDTIWNIASQLLSALVHIHSMIGDSDGVSYAVVHRNLTPDTIFISNGVLWITGFESAMMLRRGEMTDDVPILTNYMAPEIRTGQLYDERADVWSVGAILWEICAGARFTGINAADATGEGLGSIRGYHPELAELINGLLRPVAHRLTAERAKQHPRLRRFAHAAILIPDPPIVDTY